MPKLLFAIAMLVPGYERYKVGEAIPFIGPISLGERHKLSSLHRAHSPYMIPTLYHTNIKVSNSCLHSLKPFNDNSSFQCSVEARPTEDAD